VITAEVAVVAADTGVELGCAIDVPIGILALGEPIGDRDARVHVADAATVAQVLTTFVCVKSCGAATRKNRGQNEESSDSLSHHLHPRTDR
jgi:hypothetical protein